MAFKFITMKNLLYIFILFFSFGIYSQGNLQFNKVINFSFDMNSIGSTTGSAATGHGSIGTLTVPDGKVWKVTSTTKVNYDNSRNDVIYQAASDNTAVSLIKGTVKIPIFVKSAEKNWVDLPLWLSSGTYDVYGYQGTASLFHINALEFNVIP
tara:strand:+ start:2844 stop:3302 length:459 start_codon:yes stop_codon:yes gene_type:complete